jgi:hypothetical protein
VAEPGNCSADLSGGLLAYLSFALLLVFFRGTTLDTAGVVLCVG